MTYLFASEEATGIASLGLDLKAFLFQLVTFVIILWILNKFALKKIFATIEKRRLEVDAGLEAAEKAKQQLAESDIKSSAIIDEAHKKADTVHADAQKEAAEIVKEAETKAVLKAERIVAESKEQIAQDITKARTALKLETAQLVASATGTVLGQKLNTTADEKLIKQTLDEAAS